MMQLPAQRTLRGFDHIAFLALATAMVGLVFYDAGPSFLGRIGTGWARGLFLALVYAMVFVKYPLGNSSPTDRVPWYDWIMVGVSVVTIGYFAIEFRSIITRSGAPTPADIWIGSVAILLSLEAARRSLGIPIAAVAALTILYGLFGDYVPFDSFAHTGLTWGTLVSGVYSLNGIFGFVLNVIMAFVVMFVIVGALLQAFGAGALLVELPFALFGRFRGGPGIAAVAASTLFGMISGSATANTASTGAFTIPLMKRAGYPPHVAGAIEPAASTGGMFMPPVMGAGAFIMADMTGVPYLQIVAISVVPALIFFFAVAVSCYTEAGRYDLKPIPPEERPAAGPILRRGWFFILPVILLIYLLMEGFTPPRAAYWTVIATILLAVMARLVQRDQGISVGQVFTRSIADIGSGVRTAGESSLVVAALTGSVGIIVAIVFQTGVGFMLATSILDLTGGDFAIAMLMSLALSYVLGMGMPVTAVYILLAVLFAPALSQMGISLLAAHMMLFWFSQSANISPPVAISAFVGAGIAGADPIRTSFVAFRYSMFLFIMPVLFVYTPILMPDGFDAQVMMIMGGAFLSTLPFAGAFSGFLLRRLAVWERLLLLAAAIGLVFPAWGVTMVGLALLVGHLAYQWTTLPRPTMVAAADPSG